MGQRTKENKTGVHARTKEQRIASGIKGGNKAYEMKVGVHSLTTEQRSETGKKVASQKWECLETGFITNAGNLTKYQRKRGIDTSKRVKVS
jgi:hypothetical protein